MLIMSLTPWPRSRRLCHPLSTSCAALPGGTRRDPRYPLMVEELEDRTLLAGGSVTATGLSFVNGAVAAGFRAASQTPVIQAESEPNNTTLSANPIALNSITSGAITATDVDFYRLSVTQAGRLTAQVHTAGFGTRLSLFD